MVSAVLTMKDVDQWRALDLSGTGQGPYMLGADNEPARATFGCFASWSSFASSPTDIWKFTAGAGKTARIKQMIISGTATSATNVVMQLILRSTANSGGTFVSLTSVAHDQNDTAAVGATGYYTANPSSLGTAIGTVHGTRMNMAPAANGSIDRVSFNYTWQNDKALTLTSGMSLCLNMNGVSMPSGANLEVDLTWSED